MLRERLALVLIALLPFHALLVTVLTRVIAGPDRAPLSWLALWKEGVLGILLLVALVEIVHCIVGTSGKRLAVRGPEALRPEWAINDNATRYPLPATRLDFLDLLILALLALSVIVTAATHGNWGLYLFGFRYDFVPLVAFLFLRRVRWADDFMPRAMKALLWSGAVVAAYAVISFALPAGFFTWLGYSDLHSLYVPGKPVAAFQLIGETDIRRVQGPMSGPNHLGIWMLLPLACALAWLTGGVDKTDKTEDGKHKMVLIAACGLYLAALFLSFSRAAWIAAFMMCCIGFAPVVRALPRRISIGAGLLITTLIVVLASLFPSVIVRLSSSRGHLQGPIEAVQYMISEPFGRGMGMAGPASNRVSDTCVLLRESDDSSWAADRPDLCVFLGDVQVQPVGRACACPFLPENWFLQIGVEMGWIGMAAYLVLMVLVLVYVKRQASSDKLQVNGNAQLTAYGLWLAFIGVSVAALFLHAFEDAAVSYALWVLAAAVVSTLRIQRA